MATVTTDQIKKIVNNFLLSAPPGEFFDVVTDCRNLLNNDALLNEIAVDTFREYNTQQLLLVDAPSRDHKILITKQGEVGPNEYIDHHAKQVVTFDHFKQEVGQGRLLSPADQDPDAEPWRSAIESKVVEYVTNHYDRGAGAVYCTGKSSISICISSHIYNSANFYNGRWRSVWNVKIGSGKADLEGNIKVQVHYYEDGKDQSCNVQLNTNLNRKKDGLPAKDPSSLADVLVKTIVDLEGDFQNNLELSYEKMNSTTFKALRRALPIFATKIKWEKITSYTLGGDLDAKNKK